MKNKTNRMYNNNLFIVFYLYIITFYLPAKL